ncbi:hypothetical protein O3G_MSEX003755 [Manduca sexta]|uniref:Peptidyl-prolyl cis-trans isomerase n=1 Tax=Manduca sexta TaxID=7130 RepID=A0A922CGA9_MANSE|nr:hypothetical protein O3G_MSEX003755 [Manduca sexta]
MSVVIETTLGDITVDLYLEQRPVTCLNFLKLCKMKYYNFNLFHTIRSGFIAQTGDPTGEGSGGQSVFGLLEGPSKRFFSGEKMPKIRHTDAGLLSMVCTGDMMVGSQFFFTLAPDLDSLNGIHCVIGEVTEGQEVLRKLNDVICDESHRPYRDVRITHTVVLEDPFNDPPGLRAPSRSPSPSAERLKGGRIAPDEEIDETKGKSIAEVQEMLEEKEAKARATILEIIGDLPDANIAPPENVLFVCKLNPVTTDEDLEIIFSRFGKIVSCEVIRDKKTGDSLQYAFIEFSDKKSCEEAYFKMDNVLIDDRRIHVDFSQSVSKIKWLGKGRGVKHLDDNEILANHIDNQKSKRSFSSERGHRNGRDQENNSGNRSNRRGNRSRDRTSDREKRHDRQHRNEKDSEKRHRSRSKSRSKLSRHRNEIDSRHKHNSRYSEQNNDLHRDYKDSSKSRVSPSRISKVRPSSNREEEDSRHTSRENNERKEKSQHRKHRSEKDMVNNDKYKKKELHKKEKYTMNEDKGSEPRTPSPIANKKSKSRKNDKTKHVKNSHNNKKKRKHSTSTSDSESSFSSSSSSDTTSSSERDKKKNKTKIRKRRYSSSSTSSSSSDSSSSSSTTTSSSSYSSSTTESERDKKKRRKMTAKKTKPKKKL